jgi:glutathione S-transferase
MKSRMILVGQYDSPFVRRVAISLRVLGFAYEHDTRSVFGDFDAMREINPLGRIPSLILSSGETLIDSAAILDWLDEAVGPERALIPRQGPERRRALRLIALATGTQDKIGALGFERTMRPAPCRWPDWIARCRIQGASGLAALDAEPWPADAKLDQGQITTGCVFRWAQLGAPDMVPPGRYPALDALSQRLEARPEFQATNPGEWRVPRGG